MSSIFSKCISLKSLPNIFEWNTQKVTNMSNMFSECSSLELLFNITKTFDNILYKIVQGLPNKVIDKFLSGFNQTKWNTENVKDMV